MLLSDGSKMSQCFGIINGNSRKTQNRHRQTLKTCKHIQNEKVELVRLKKAERFNSRPSAKNYCFRVFAAHRVRHTLCFSGSLTVRVSLRHWPSEVLLANGKLFHISIFNDIFSHWKPSCFVMISKYFKALVMQAE